MKSGAVPEELLLQLASLPDESARVAFLHQHAELFHAGVVEAIDEMIARRARVNLQESLGLAEAALLIAEGTAEDRQQALGHAYRAKANVCYLLGNNQEAASLHERALAAFEECGIALEAGRTLSSLLQPLTLLGEYERATAVAERAREVFRRIGAPRRVARVDLNAANILHRQDRFAEALAVYERAHDQFLVYQDWEALTVALHNMAVCLISLNDFHRAEEVYDLARARCQEHGMPLLAAQADYNIAYLYYHRGEYGRAIQMLRAAREACEQNGDQHHTALCFLDLSELYLEINLSKEAAEMAQEAQQRFEALKMNYEAAKARTFLAIAAGQQGQVFRAVELFEQTRKSFVAEKNHVWPWLIDLYQALLLAEEGRDFEARRLAVRAAESFSSSGLPAKAALSNLLLARIALRGGKRDEALVHCGGAMKHLAGRELPALEWRAHFLIGQIQEAAGQLDAAFAAFKASRQCLESLRSSLRHEDLKISFFKNKQEVYENLVDLCLKKETSPASADEAFGYMEEAKSRSLRDLLLGLASPISAPAGAGQSELVQKIHGLRQELNWFYHRLEAAELSEGSTRSGQAPVEQLRELTRQREKDLQRALLEAPVEEFGRGLTLQTSTPLSLEQVRAALPADSVLVEYFRVRDQFLAAVVTHNSVETIRLTPVSRVVSILRLLHFQLGRFRLGPEYVARFQDSMMQATVAHLHELHEELWAPLQKCLPERTANLILVPHDVLHHLPFHALHDGDRYLIDAYRISYAPSASIFVHCQKKATITEGGCLVLGVPDAQAPSIGEEAEAVAQTMPGSELYLGDRASTSVLRQRGPESRFIHIAAHGHFRQDNPLFSGLRLGDGYLNLHDLYELRLRAELVTLSGCATGLNVLAGGDELLGLVRGLLHAGGQALLLTLWDVYDSSTSQFMKAFYRSLREGESKPVAWQKAVAELRLQWPHPYFWAPFALVGKAF